MIKSREEHRRGQYAPQEPDTHEPLFKCGDILRYDYGETALFQVEYISPRHGGHHRYYGQQCYGGSCGRYEFQSELASEEDIKTWDECSNWRRPYKERDRNIVGAVED